MIDKERMEHAGEVEAARFILESAVIAAQTATEQMKLLGYECLSEAVLDAVIDVKTDIVEMLEGNGDDVVGPESEEVV